MLREIRDEALLINVDESSYSRSIRRNYSWLPVGSSNPIINDRWFGRTSIIFGLVSNGEWLWINVNETTKSSDYWLFITLLKKFLDSLKLNNRGAFKLLVDNASIHISKESRRTWAYNGFESILYQPILQILHQWSWYLLRASDTLEDSLLSVR